ncbi:alpha/beta hydrolase [Thalassospiraceae bacterium LMO-JJ14]|nr:alpha/beta hydrolase [Thalassospiraceae bacterium LMO-JJ14]
MPNVSVEPREYVENLIARAEIVKTPSGDGDMEWHVWGTDTGKTPLLLLHGGFGSWTHWMANVEVLSKERLVVTCDMPGLGNSASALGDVTPDSEAEPIIAGLDTVLGKTAAFDLAGFSFGGMIGARVAKAVGERVRTYVAVGASGFGDLHVRVVGTAIPKRSMSDQEKNDIHRRNLGLLMLHDKHSIDALAVYTHRQNIARARVRSRPLSLGSHLIEALPDVKARLGGIWGVHDATGGGRDQLLKRRDIFAAYQPDVPFVIIEDAGHWVMYEAPDEFNAALLGILDR